MELTFEISLRHLATIAAADSLWLTENILNKTKTYFLSPTQEGKLQMWDSLTKAVLNQVDPGSLPAIVYTDLVYAVTILGYKRRDWFRYYSMRNIFRDVPKEELYEHYLNKIYWTYYGTVDEEKIIRSWFQNPNCDVWKVYVMASCFCSEEFIKEVWMEAKKIHPPENFEKLYDSYGWHMAAYWNRYFSNNLENFLSDIQSKWALDFYNLERSVEENMFKLCVFRGYTKLAKKFWFELDENSRAKTVIECLKETLTSRRFRINEYARYYRHDHFVEIYLFSSKDTSGNPEASIIEIIANDINLNLDFGIITEQMVKWPWVKMIVPFVNYRKNFLDKKFYSRLFFYLSNEALANRSNFGVKDNIIQRTFIHLLNKLPRDYKKAISKNVIINQLIIAWDFVNLKRILNDDDFVVIKRELVSLNYYTELETFVMEDNQVMIKQFINLLIPTKWEESIRKNMGLVYEHAMNCRFDAADEILKSFCRSEEVMNGFKNEIDPYLLCCYFVKKKELNNMDKFLHWKFNSKMLESAYRQFFFSDKVLLNYILDFWNVDELIPESVKIECNKLFLWLFPSGYYLREAVRARLLLEKCHIIRTWSLTTKRFDILNDLIDWFSEKEEQKHAFKKHARLKILEGSLSVMGNFMRENEWDVAEKYLNFVCDTVSEKETLMRTFLEAENSAVNCKLFISKTCEASTLFDPKPPQEEIIKKMKEFIKFWMKPLKGNKRHSLKEVLRDWPNVSKEIFQNEQKVNENFDFDEESDPEEKFWYSRKHEYICCDESNWKLFMELLSMFDDSNGEF